VLAAINERTEHGERNVEVGRRLRGKEERKYEGQKQGGKKWACAREGGGREREREIKSKKKYPNYPLHVLKVLAPTVFAQTNSKFKL